MIKINKASKITIFEIALMSIMFSIGILVSYLNSITPTIFKIQSDFIFFILAGVIFGPFKGALFSIFLDTTGLFLYGGIALWIWQYAIVPPAISIFSSLIFKLTNKKYKNIKILVSTILISLINLIFLAVILPIFLVGNNLQDEIIDPKISISITASLIFIMNIFLFFSLFLIKFKKNIKIVEVLLQTSIVFFIFVIFRWLWGSYALIELFKNMNLSTIDPYITVLLGISFKSIFSVPFFSLVLISLNNPLSNLLIKYKRLSW